MDKPSLSLHGICLVIVWILYGTTMINIFGETFYGYLTIFIGGISVSSLALYFNKLYRQERDKQNKE